MAHNLVLTSSNFQSPTVPDSGDPRTAASVNGAFQTLYNNTGYLFNLSQTTYTASIKSALVDKPQVYCDDALGNTMRIGVSNAVIDNRVLLRTNVPLTASNSDYGFPYSVNWFYYLYASASLTSSAGVSFEKILPVISANTPIDGKYYSGNPDMLFLCSVPTRTTTQHQNFYHTNGETWFFENSVWPINNAITGSASSADNVINLTGLIPNHVRRIIVQLTFDGATTVGSQSFQLLIGSKEVGLVQGQFQALFQTASHYVINTNVTLNLDADKNLVWSTPTGGCTFSTGQIYLMGWVE